MGWEGKCRGESWEQGGRDEPLSALTVGWAGGHFSHAPVILPNTPLLLRCDIIAHCGSLSLAPELASGLGCKEIIAGGMVWDSEWQLRQVGVFSSFIENNDIWALSKFTFRGLKSLTHL